MNLQEMAQHLRISIKAEGEVWGPHPRVYSWRCWLGDEMTQVFIKYPNAQLRAYGHGNTLDEAVADMVEILREKTLVLIKHSPRAITTEEFLVPAELKA